MSRRTLITLGIYAACILAVFAGMQKARRAALATYGSIAAQDEWEDWRETVRQETPTNGSAYRRVPKSALPPALVLMRDYYWQCTVFALVMCSALFVTMTVVVRGVLQETVVRSD